MPTNWQAIIGQFETEDEDLLIPGGTYDHQGDLQPLIGNYLTNHKFAGGTISAEIMFDEISPNFGCEIILFYNPETNAFVTAGLSSSIFMFALRSYSEQRWTTHRWAGDGRNLKAKEKYKLDIKVSGSLIEMDVNGINVIKHNFLFNLPQSHVGVWSQSASDIRVSKFKVETSQPEVFVVMEFSSPFDDLYKDVIKSVCKKHGFNAIRADDSYSPGVIITEIEEQIVRSKFVIAEVTPANPNVYYEVGFAQAINKPTILVAQKGVNLPFDIRPFRVLFYENTIGGKLKVEEQLDKHIETIISEGFIL